MKALDIETRSLDDAHQEYALQPWRVKDSVNLTGPDAEITMIAVGDSSYAEFTKLSNLQEGETFVCWNAMFDMTFLAAAGLDIKKFKWLDAMHLTKWVENCQDNDKLGYSLVKCAKRWLTDWDLLEKFVKLKETEADPSYDKYWKVRARLDVMATHMIAERALRRLTSQQRKSAMIEAKNLIPNALAWLSGIPTKPKYYNDPIPGLSKEMAEIECRLGVANPAEGDAVYGGDGWLPSKILRSPKQLAETLYTKWGLPCKHRTDKGAPATDKTALTYLADKDDKALEILRWRHLNTRLTKFCQSPGKAAKYLGSSRLHPEPKIFSTYTGRYTYGSKSGKNLISMALHQIPRGPEVRRMVEAPEGKILVEFDASGQEQRLLAEIGDVYTMLDMFTSGRKGHAVMGAAIAGIPYDEFMKRYKAGDEAYAGPEGLYYCGKFVGLSMQYRVGEGKHRVMARVQYGLDKDSTTIKRWRALYHSTFPEVKAYWKRAVARAKMNGYAETLAGRRYYINKWGEDHRWSSESSAINFPIQGSGADMKNLAITTLTTKYPELEFLYDVHDGIFFWAPRSKEGMQLCKEAQQTLNNLDYEKAWGWKPRIPLPWDLSIGLNWGEMKEI